MAQGRTLCLTRPILVQSSALTVVLGVIGYRILMDFGYRALVAESFDYQGFRSESTPQAALVSWLFLLSLVPLLLRVIRTETLSGQVTTLLAMTSLVPTTTLIAHDLRYTGWYLLLLYVYWLVFLVACVIVPAIRPFHRLFHRSFRSEIPHVLVFVVSASTILYLSWQHTGFRLHFGLFDVYELRAEAREYQVATIIGYVATISDNVLPVLLAFYLRRQWLVLSAMVMVVILFNFGISATKQVMFLLMFALASVAVRERTRLGQKVLPVLASFIMIGILERLLFDTNVVGGLLMHRVLFLPAYLHGIYYEFFQANDLLYLTQSALRFFFESSYRENVQFLLGEYFIDDFTARANNGLFSDGYMNFGAASVLFYPVLCVAVLKLLEGAASGLSKSVQFVVILVAAFVIQGVPLPTAMLNSGLGFLIILLPTLPRPGNGAAPAAPVPA